VFCRIISGEEPAHVVYQDAHTMAFLDRVPLFHGHSLLVPKEHHETLPDLPHQLLVPLFAVSQRLAAAMVDVIGATGSFVAINNTVSQSVPHLHVHVVPRRAKDGLRGFFWPRHRYDDDEQMAQVAERLRAGLSAAE
jgi:histidine triad (HIT) family protein